MVEHNVWITAYALIHPNYSNGAIADALQKEHMFKDRQDNSYPPRSHDCTPNETEFTNAHEEAQFDVERREKNIKHRRTMKMWKNSVEQVWKNRPIE